MTLDYRDCSDPDKPLAVVTFRNDSGEEWCYGKYFHLEVLLDGVWYVVPTASELDFPDIAMLLPAGKEQQEEYWLAPYGELPAGTYRIVVEGMADSFVIPDVAMLLPSGE